MQVGTLGKIVPGVLREVPYAAVVAGAASAFGHTHALELKIGFIELVTEAESMATAPTIARNLFVAVTDTHAEGGEGGTCEASSARMTSHARAVAPIPLSPLGGAYCGHRHARAA